MGFTQDLKKRALKLGQKAVERLMADDKRALRVAEAVGSMQRGKQALNRGQDDLLRALNFAAKGDFKALGKQLSGLKRRVRELDEKMDTLAERSTQGH